MEIILLERVGKLGELGDVVTVKDGYARNYLLPGRKALRATPTNLERFEKGRDELEKANATKRGEAASLALKLDGTSWVLIRQASESFQLYGSVTARDIATAITESGLPITRQQVRLDAPIKVLGVYPVTLALHPEVDTVVRINVARSPEEALLQAAAPEGATPARAPGAGIDAAEEEAPEIEELMEEAAAAEAEAEAAESGAGGEAPAAASGPAPTGGERTETN